jgi:putative acyl-CoA dehydrogenase
MSAIGATAYATHEVFNQATPLSDFDAFGGDVALKSAVRAFGLDGFSAKFADIGRLVGSDEVQALARDANRFGPTLESHDRLGHRVDRIAFHPAYHELMRRAIAAETHSFGWIAKQPKAHQARAVLAYLWSQGEVGIMCPLLMTYASIASLRVDPAMAARWEPQILSRDYDPRPIAPAQKRGLTVGMAMTEKQGGSDLRQITTTARPGDGGYLITGHKWFFSAPQSDLFLTLARTEAGITCFLAPGWLPDGTRNCLVIQRLKDKCGNRSNASSEVEFRDLWAERLGNEGQGIRTILAMGHVTRLDCAISSAAMQRLALIHAVQHCATRSAFQKRLIDQPLMTNVLADLALEAEAAMWAALRLASGLDAAPGTHDHELNRIATPLVKYWVCKRTPPAIAEAMECHGGNGYVEDAILARLYREAPLNGIWEGSGNVICLDVLRAFERERTAAEAYFAELDAARGADRRYDAFVDTLQGAVADAARQSGLRLAVERLALALQASLLLRFSSPEVADAFIASRLGGEHGRAFGTLPNATAFARIIERARGA